MAIFTNQATLSYSNGVTNSNVAVGEVLDVLSGSKTAVMDDYVLNDDVTYVISLVNTGSLPILGLTITDNLGAYPWGPIPTTLYPLTYTPGSVRYYINGTLQPAPVVVPGPPLVISGINIPANGNVTIIYEVTANQYAPLGVNSSILNQAVVSGGGLSTPLNLYETIYTQDVANLTITKSISPVPVIENGTLTYTFIIQNSGNTAASLADNVILTDDFDPILALTSVTFNGAPWVEPFNYTYNTLTGLFATVPGQITVPPANYVQDPVTGKWIINPGVSTLIVTGTV